MNPDRYIAKVLWTGILITSLSASFAQTSSENDSLTRTPVKITPFLVPAYSPEVELMIVAGGVLTFQTGYDQTTDRSTLPFNVGYSTNNSKEIDARPVIFLPSDVGRFFGRTVIQEMPDHYFGVGYDGGRNTEQTDTTTRYKRLYYQIDINYVHRIIPDFFAGLRFDFNRTRASEVSQYMLQDPEVMKFGTDIQNTGVGIVAQYDSRDFVTNAYSGLLLQFVATSYGTIINSDYSFQIYTLDYRQYKSLNRRGKTLAWQIRFDIGSGDVPWTELPKLGTPFSLRGYRFGKYRDKSTGFALVEYRHMFQKKPDPSGQRAMSRHGFVIWAGTGSLGTNPGQWTNWLPNFGVGYRFEAQPRVNVRVDFGFGLESNGFYLNFNEAF